jgi:cytidylate kinase
MAATITISSSYGADGASVGREVAARLGLEYYDRAIPVAVARELAVAEEEAIAKDWRAPGRMQVVLAALASESLPFMGSSSELYANPDAFRDATEQVLLEIASTSGGVILGRAAMVVLQGRPDVLSVRIDGPVEQRIAHAAAARGIDEQTARREQRETDAARDAYLHTFYGRRPDDIELFHLVIDCTAFSQEATVDLVLGAARDRLGLG